jgi:hypothetical protein
VAEARKQPSVINMTIEEDSSSTSEKESLTEEDHESGSSGEEREAEEGKVCLLLHTMTPQLAFTPLDVVLQKDFVEKRSQKHVAESSELTQEGQDIPFEQLVRMRQHGGITKQELQKVIERAKAKSFKRENKNRPMEMSSKRPVPRLREVVEGTRRYALPQMSLCHPASPLGIPAVPSHA